MLSLNGSNTFSGATTISAGTINVGNALALQNSTVSATSNNIVTFSVPAATLGGLTGNGSINLNSAALSVGR